MRQAQVAGIVALSAGAFLLLSLGLLEGGLAQDALLVIAATVVVTFAVVWLGLLLVRAIRVVFRMALGR